MTRLGSFNDIRVQESSGSVGDWIFDISEFIVRRITVIKFGVDDRGSSGIGS